MKYLYLDNFRGFTNTFIPITDVNFLVGENSTGKTSVLAVFRLISSMRFWFNQDFDSEEFSFGHFRDIVSIHSSDQRYFRIGLVEEGSQSRRSNTKNVRTSRAFLASFKEHDGLPRITHFSFNRKDTWYTLKFTRAGIYYKVQSKSASDPANTPWTRIFALWSNEHRSAKSGYKKINIPDSIREDMPLAFAISLLGAPKKNDEASAEEMSVDIRIPVPLPNVVWVAPIRTLPQRTYDAVKLVYSPEGTHTPYVIRKILDSKREAGKFLASMQRIGDASGLFESIGIRRYGRGVTAPFEVDIVLDRKALNLSTVGYGVSQSLPVLVELLIRPENTWFAIQQPEVHLHPKAQAALGDVFFEMATREQKHFLIETHSDFTIDRFRMNYKGRKGKIARAQILFFERKNRQNKVHSLIMGENGELPQEQPESYRRFFVKEELKLLGI